MLVHVVCTVACVHVVTCACPLYTAMGIRGSVQWGTYSAGPTMLWVRGSACGYLSASVHVVYVKLCSSSCIHVLVFMLCTCSLCSCCIHVLVFMLCT